MLKRPEHPLIYISVPDPEGSPLTYTTVGGFNRTSRGNIFEVLKDEFGYFYEHHGKHYLPRRPESFDVAE
jgi:hypothetical protein